MSGYNLPDDFEPMSLEEVAAEEAAYQAKLLTFYDVRKEVFVAVEKAKVTKFTFKPHNANMRYGLRGELADGWKAHKFIDEDAWRFLDVPFEEQPR